MSCTNSLRQAAIVLNSLPKGQAARLLSRLEASDMKSVLDVAAELDNISAEQITECLDKLKTDSQALEAGDSVTTENLRGTKAESVEVERAKIQIERALSAVPHVSPSLNQSQRPFDFLAETIPTVRTHVLSDEHPRNIAIILSMFPPDIASVTMSGLETNLRISVLKRMCELEEIHDDDVTELSYAIRMRLNKLLNSSTGRSAGLKSAANLLSCSDSATREALLAHVGQSDPDLASTLERSVFGVERLCDFSDSDIKTVLKNVDTACWAPALKNASSDLIDKVLGNMAGPPRELLSHEISEIGYVDAAQEDTARKNIVNTVLGLAREGKVNVQSQTSQTRIPHTAFPSAGRMPTTVEG